tara:strand:+ start:95 stop:679 length:585 start_codon:yes stop_codon:yes gene_type:complete
MTSQNPAPLSNRFRKMVCRLIDFESKHRKQITTDLEVLKNRKYMKQIRDAGGNIVVQNAYGIQGKNLSNEDIDALDLDRINNLIETTEKGLQHSLWKEKFFRYCHNNNLKKAEEYCEKLQNWWFEDNETMREAVMEGKEVWVELNYGDAGGLKTHKQADVAYKEHSDEMLRFYKLRKSLKNQLKIARNLPVEEH